MARNVPPECLCKDRVAKILEDLFVINRAEQSEEDHTFRISQTQGEEEQDLRLTEEDLLMTMTKCDPRKAAGVEGVPGEIVRIVEEQQPRRSLNLFNSINRSGQIPAVWRVVLLPKPTKDPLFKVRCLPTV